MLDHTIEQLGPRLNSIAVLQPMGNSLDFLIYTGRRSRILQGNSYTIPTSIKTSSFAKFQQKLLL